MPKSFTGPEFLKALSEGSLKEAITLEGMVKPDPNDHHTILFSEGTSCVFWTKIPVKVIEKVEYLTTVRCQDHEHPLVRLHLEEPPEDNKLASAFAELVRRSSSPHSQGATVAPLYAPMARRCGLPIMGEWPIRGRGLRSDLKGPGAVRQVTPSRIFTDECSDCVVVNTPLGLEICCWCETPNGPQIVCTGTV